MFTEVKELLLSETYSFDVLVRSVDQTFAADLRISPEIVTLRIMGETDSTRKLELDSWKIDELRCSGLRDSFLLLGLSLIEGGWRSVGPNNRNYFENTYEVRELFHLHSGNGIATNTQVWRINLHSPSITQWLGHTRLQHEVIGYYHEGTLHSQPHGFNIELACKTDEGTALVVSYDIRDGYSISEFQSHMSFLPLAGEEFASMRDLSSVPQRIGDLLAIFSFICGGPLTLDRIAFVPYSSSLGATGSYYRKGLGRETRREHRPILIPFDTLPSIESEAQAVSWGRTFGSYFQNTSDLRHFFSQYLKYRALDSTEERFLGFFRLLEKLTFQTATFVDADKLATLLRRAKPLLTRYLGDEAGAKSLLRRVPQLNQSKYNTEKCIATLLNRLPEDMVSNWRLTAPDLASVCKLRNDMVHANNHQIAEDEMLSMMVFVELLLTAALAERISIPVEQCKNYLPRHQHYSHIAKHYGVKT
jgi:hypothetical protein